MSKYLEEDKDIIAKIKSAEFNNTSLTIAESTNLLSRLQIEATLRNRKSLDDSRIETGRFSWVLFGVAIIQVAIALFQLFFSIWSSNNILYGSVTILALLIVIFIVIKDWKK